MIVARLTFLAVALIAAWWLFFELARLLLELVEAVA